MNHKIIKKIKHRLLSKKNPINILRNSFEGRTALVVSAGPSAVGWKEIYKRILFEKPIVVCIKQSIELEGLDTLCDIHFINPYNLKKYKYITKPLVIFSDSTDAPNVYNKYDLRFIVQRDPGPPFFLQLLLFQVNSKNLNWIRLEYLDHGDQG